MSLLQFTNDLHNKNLTIVQKHGSFQSFIQYYDQLKTAVLGTSTYSNQQLSEHIFRNSWNENQGELVFKKQMYAAHMTLSRLSGTITVTNFSDYEFMLTMLSYDLYKIVVYAEFHYRNNSLTFEMGSRGEQNAREIFDISRSLFNIGAINPANFYLREIIPVSVFLLRQTVEIYGRRTIGFYSITDIDGNRARNVSTQVAWDFIKKEILKSHPRITLPTNIDVIRRVETCTNSYVHTGNIPEVFLIENAIQFVWPLIYPQNSTEENYKRQIRFAGTTIIRDYNSIKADFTEFINSKLLKWYERAWNSLLLFLRIRKEQKRKIAEWMHIDSVDATIKNLE